MQAVATALTVHGIETLSRYVSAYGMEARCNSTYRSRY